MASGRDPIQRATRKSRDLYDVANWEPRTRLDALAVSVYEGVRTTARWTVVLAGLAILLVLFTLGGLGAIVDPHVGAFVVLSAVPALAFALYIWHVDVTSGEPLGLLVATFCLAVLFAGFAGIVNTAVSSLQQLSFGVVNIGVILFYYLVVGPVEEFVKLLAVWLYPFRSGHFDAVIDGAVYGAVAGLGFATIENAIYIAQYLQNGAGPLASIALVRGFAGPGHVIYSGIAGYYLGLAKFNREYFGPIVVKGLLLAAFVHGTYNVTVGFVPGFVASNVAAVGPGAAFVGYVIVYDATAGLFLYRKLQRYRSEYRDTDAGRDYTDETLSPDRTEFDPSHAPNADDGAE